MNAQIAIKPYRRRFRRALRTARGEWVWREGFLLRVEQDGRIGYGEVAPLPEFGTETLEAAGEFLERLAAEPNLEVPSALPCCAFGLSAALVDAANAPREYAVSALLPAGPLALERAAEKIQAGYRSLKWKIGVVAIAEEIALARELLEFMPEGTTLRLDANGGLRRAQVEQWLELLARFPGQVDYLEQPLPCGEEAVMAQLMEDTGVPVALDESLNGPKGARWLVPDAWAGPLVVKAGLMGDVGLLLERLAPVAERVVLSSVFETAIGLENCLRIADALPQIRCPIGFDTLDAFDDALNPLNVSPRICTADRNTYTLEQIWNVSTCR